MKKIFLIWLTIYPAILFLNSILSLDALLEIDAMFKGVFLAVLLTAGGTFLVNILVKKPIELYAVAILLFINFLVIVLYFSKPVALGELVANLREHFLESLISSIVSALFIGIGTSYIMKKEAEQKEGRIEM